MKEDESDLFQQEMQDVEPLPKNTKVALKRTKNNSPGQEARRQAAVTAKQLDENFLSSQVIEMVDPFEVLSYKRPSIQHGVFKKLRQGAYNVESVLDLHRLSVDRARTEVFAFINDGLKYGLRTVLILHGKGDRNKEAPALLKSYTARWLQEMPQVMAYHSAVNRAGGVGAVYVLLKKNESSKQDNRERHGLR